MTLLTPVSRAWGMGVGAVDTLRFCVDWIREHHVRTGLTVAGFLGFLWLGKQPIVYALLIGGLYAFGGWLWWAEGRHSDTPRRQLAQVLLPPTVLGWFAVMGMWLPVVSLLTAVSLVALLYATAPEPEPERWWSEESLTDLLFGERGLLGRRDDVVLSRHGQPVTDALGTSVTFTLPGFSWEAVQAKHKELAAALGLNRSQLEVRHDRDAAENVVTLWIGEGPRALPTRATTDLPAWGEPVDFAPDRQGRWVKLLTRNKHTVFVAETGAGKTWAARWFVLPAVADPEVDLYLIEGKDGVEDSDWSALAPLALMSAFGSGEVAVRQVEVILQAVEDRRQRGRGRPAVLIVDEWFKIRRTAMRVGGKPLLDKLDGLLGELAATARSAGIHIVMCAQRGTVEYLPGDLQANLTQRIVGKTAKEAEVRYVLDTAPAVLPDAPGVFLVSEDGSTPTLTVVPPWEDGAWEAACERAAKTRTPVETPVSLVKAAGSLEDEVYRLLLGGEMLSSVLWERLPDEVRPVDAGAMGRRLGKCPEFSSRRTAKGSMWALSVTPSHAQVSVQKGSAVIPSLPSGASV